MGLTGYVGASSQGWALLPTREKSVGNNLRPNRTFIALVFFFFVEAES